MPSDAELDPLHASLQDIATLLDAAYWRAAVPWLTVSRDSLRERDAKESADEAATAAAATAVAAAAAAAVAAAAAAAAVAAAAAAAVALAPAAAILVPAAAVVVPAAAILAPAVLLAPVVAAALPAAAALLPRSPSADKLAAAAQPFAPAAAARELALRARGYVHIDFAELTAEAPAGAGFDAAAVDALRRGLLRLVALGHSPSAVSAYDEAWQVAAALTPVASRATGGRLRPTGDWFCFLKSFERQGGFLGPHRDKPTSGPESHSPEGDPGYVTVWLALSDATPESSCLYFFPRDAADAGYEGPGDCIAPLAPRDWEAVIAQPCKYATHALTHPLNPPLHF